MEKKRVLADKDSIPKCDWCGTYYSPKWVQMEVGGRVYCSHECALAGSTDLSEGEIMQSKWPIIFAMTILISCIGLSIIAPVYAPIWMIMILLSFCCSCCGLGMRQRAREAKKYLSRKNQYRDTYPTQLECPFCSHLNQPEALDCRFCQGSLRDAKSVSGMIPDWFDTEEIDRKPVQCPHCGSSYIYMKAGEEATVNCQHCGKPFSMSKAT